MNVLFFNSQQELRKWFQENYLKEDEAWIGFYNKKSEKLSITWTQLVDEALCFGWIDSKKIKIDTETSHQFFSKRKAQSTWSKINKVKVQNLIEKGLMTQAGLESIEVAKQNGSWTILDEVEDLIIPIDLERAFEKHKGSKDYFLSLSKSIRKMMLTSLVLAKRPETRQKRVDEIAEFAGQNKKPKQY